ncbi:helix-turn-helix transcriptional regulator [Methylocapsa sp. S129]|uniref:helix-turn-helix domain-containing protein n=1 Tax=Methylocapsa sp. S129 TaxID=1641869 RepID=UPI00131D5A61|nr:helix-turn-helix transcriptional regulator [Methylocapsa sp. S129]
MTIAPARIKAARGVLGWTQAELARRSNAPSSVIALLETRKRLPAPAVLDDLRSPLDSFGIKFVEGESDVKLPRGDHENAAPAV